MPNTTIGADAALARLVAAVEAETDPDWDCNSYHPSLWIALDVARAALASAAQPAAEWPQASVNDAANGWILDYRFLEKVETLAKTRTNYSTSMEATEQVLVAAQEVLAAAPKAAPAPTTQAAPAADAGPSDDFHGGTPSLVRAITALLALDAEGALAPHGVGGHARTLLAAAASRLAAPAPSAQELLAEIQRLQRALAFWLPQVPAEDHLLQDRIAHDAFLLAGYSGPNEPSANELGHVALTTAPAPAAQGDALVALIEHYGRVEFQRYRVGPDGNSTRWDIELGHGDLTVSSVTLPAAIAAAIAAVNLPQGD